MIPLAAAAMTPDYFTGLDLHKRSVTATTVDAAGTVVATAKMPCRPKALRAQGAAGPRRCWPKALRAYVAQTPGEHAATVECTTGWYCVEDAIGATIDLHLAHAKGVKAISAAKVTTDSADAAMLAHLLRTDLLPEAHMIADELRPLRDVFRTRLRLVERRVSAQNSIARLLEKDNVRDVAERDAFGRLQAETHIEQAELLHAQITRLETALHPHLVPDDDVQRLLRIPGIGKIVAFSVRLEVDDIARVERERAVFSYCRVVPGGQSARTTRARTTRARTTRASASVTRDLATATAISNSRSRTRPCGRSSTTRTSTTRTSTTRRSGRGTARRSAARPTSWRGRSWPRRSPASCTTC